MSYFVAGVTFYKKTSNSQGKVSSESGNISACKQLPMIDSPPDSEGKCHAKKSELTFWRLHFKLHL